MNEEQKKRIEIEVGHVHRAMQRFVNHVWEIKLGDDDGRKQKEHSKRKTKTE